MKCFLSCSFWDEDKDTVAWFRDFLNAFPDLEIIEARDVPLPPIKQVEQCIASCDFVCAIITRRGESVPSWILNEVGMAHNEGKIIIAFVEDAILIKDLGSLPSITEFKVFQRNTLGWRAPEYLRYIYNAPVEILKKLHLDRATLRSEVEFLRKRAQELSFAVTVMEAQRDRLDNDEL